MGGVIDIRRILRKLRYKSIKENAGYYGCEYSLRRYLLVLLVMLFCVVGVGIIYSMSIYMMAAIFLVSFVCVMLLIENKFKMIYNQRRFNDVDIYVHQMAYSFQREAKINLALSDTFTIGGDRLKEKISSALKAMEYAKTSKVYEEALRLIEDEYKCEKISTLHRFLVNIEQKGGNYHNSLSVLIEDADRWVKRVYKQQEDMKRVRITTGVGILIGFAVASVSVLISCILKGTSELSMDITNKMSYQITCMLYVAANIIFFTYMQISCNVDWIQKLRNEKALEKDYNLVFHMDYVKIRRNIMPVVILLTISIIVCTFLGSYMISAACVVLIVVLAFVPSVNRTSALRRIKCELYYIFSEWLRDVALNLQHEPLQVAIESTYDNCSYILKEPLEKFIYAIEDNPSDVKPYYDFLNEYNILDLSSTIRMLYSFAELDYKNIDESINTLIKRNYELVDKFEENRNMDQVSVKKFFEYIPTLFVSFKLSVDMILIVTSFL